jgi:cell division septation protein DedD
MVTRTQRRTEKKQAWSIVALVAVVAFISFAFGVVVGQQGFFSKLGEDSVTEVRLPMATQIPVPQPPPKEESSNLTFYDNLPQGNQAPLGSGINLPPKTDSPPTIKSKPVVKKQVPVAPEKAISKPAVAQTATAPAKHVSASGAFVVQIASFRTAEDAQKLRKRLMGMKIDAFVEQADLGEKGVWHRVLAGPYAERATADQVAAQLKQKERLSALVRRR